TCFVVLMNFAEAHELVEDGEVHILETFPLIETPVVVGLGKQITCVQRDGVAELHCLLGGKVVAGNATSFTKCSLEGGYINPDIRVRPDADPFGIDNQNGAR